MSDFNEMAERFTQRVRTAANWKNAYYGASYSTRIKEAIAELRSAIAEVDKFTADLAGRKARAEAANG